MKKVHDDIYSKSDPYDPNSDTYMTLIIKSVFSSENERTKQNAIWVQSVLEVIFDEQHLSLKIDTEVLGSWIKTLTDKEHIVIIISKKFIRFFVKYLKYFNLLRLTTPMTKHFIHHRINVMQMMIW